MTQSPGVLFERLLDIMHRLRGPAGCPWDREQTRISLKPYLIEEAYEVLEAIESGHVDGVREKLGDPGASGRAADEVLAVARTHIPQP